jgi:hypothetical protein
MSQTSRSAARALSIKLHMRVFLIHQFRFGEFSETLFDVMKTIDLPAFQYEPQERRRIFRSTCDRLTGAAYTRLFRQSRTAITTCGDRLC